MALRAATTFFWRGTVDTVFTKHTNWVITGGGAPDADDYPGWDNSEGGGSNVNGDSIIYDLAVTNACAGADNSAKGMIAALKVYPAYDKALASSGAYLILNMTAAGEVIIQGTAAGDIFLKGGGANGLKKVISLDTKTTGTASRLYLDGTLGTVELFKCLSTIKATAVIGTALTIGYLTGKYTDVNLTIEVGATLPATVNANGGTVVNSNAVTALNHSEGTWTQAAGAVTTLRNEGGEFKWNAGNITTAYIMDGSLNASGAQGARTCTDCYLYEAGEVNLNTGAADVTILIHSMCDEPNILVTPGQIFGIP